MRRPSALEDKNSAIRQFIDGCFPHMNRLAQGFLRDARTRMRERTELDSGSILPEDDTGDYDWARTGTAFDYRARLYFQVTPREELIAYGGAVRLKQVNLTRKMDSQAQQDFIAGKGVYLDYIDGVPEPEFEEFFISLDAWLASHQTVGTRLSEAEEDELNRYCVAMAMMDAMSRASEVSWKLNAYRHELLGIADDATLADMRKLSWRFFDEWDRKGMFDKSFILAPKFNMGGETGDLIVDRCLYDIKTSKNAKIPLEFLRQLIGYVLLDYSDEYELDSIGLYMSRQGMTCKWDLNDALVALTDHGFKTLPDMRDELKIELEEIIG